MVVVMVFFVVFFEVCCWLSWKCVFVGVVYVVMFVFFVYVNKLMMVVVMIFL